jgi:hypothetical protein
VHLTGDDPNQPTLDFFDVHEAYWSPIDKGKTTPVRVLQWLLTTVFLPINDTARYMERFKKVAWDIGFLLGMMLLGTLAFIGSVLAAAWALGATQLHVSGMPSFGQTLEYLVPLTLLKGLTPSIVTALVAGFVGAYLLAQGVRAVWSLFHNLRVLLAGDPLQLTSRVIAIGILFALAAVGILVCILMPTSNGKPLLLPGLALAATVLFFQAGRALLLWFLQNFFGDVQIYTTRDENSDFFALREQILDLVTKTIISVADSSPVGQPYDRVHVLAHSLGSTIAMDALLRIYNAQKAGSVPSHSWDRIRSFVTFGSSLEKTKYFFNAWSPTASQSYEEWQNDLYGPLFTSDPSTLEPPTPTHGIYWLNCWYFTDFVSDEMNSYRSYVLPGQPPSTRRKNRDAARAHAQKIGKPVAGRLVADNRTRFGDWAPWRLHFVTHGDYLGDQNWFWAALPAKSRLQAPPPPPPPAPPNAPAPNAPVPPPPPSPETGVIDVVTSGLAWATPHPKLQALSIAPHSPLPYDDTPPAGTSAFLTPDVMS